MNEFIHNYSTGQFATYGFVCTNPTGGGGFAVANYTCPNGEVHQEGMCVDDQYTLTLTGDTQTEPSQPLSYVVTIIDKATQQPPTKAVTVKISLTVDDKSGGHDHGDSTRPRGSINDEACASDDTCITLTAEAGAGTAPFTFTPRDASGKHTITATCDKCSSEGTGNTKTVEVKVDGLEQIPDSTFYSLTEPDPTPENPNQRKFVGATPKHSDNHYLKPEAANYLLALAIYYQTLPQFKKLDWRTGVPTTAALKPFAVNDASLKDGGKFDINGSWAGSHAEHKRGGSVDIRANRWGWSAIPPAAFKDFSSLLDMVVPKGNAKEKFLLECTKDKKDADGKPIPPIHNRLADNHCFSLFDYSEDTNRHYHVRLLGD